MRHFTSDDYDEIISNGKRAIKRPNPVHLYKREEMAFTVGTNEGVLTGKAGDYVAYDPISGHVWPVSASYVEQHYDFID